jgi:hypothetical protein
LRQTTPGTAVRSGVLIYRGEASAEAVSTYAIIEDRKYNRREVIGK